MTLTQKPTQKLTQWIGRITVCVVAAGIGCTVPTAICACTPSRSAIVARGVLTMANGQPVAGALIGFDGEPAQPQPTQLYYGDWTTTDASGAFVHRAHSAMSPGPYQLHVAVHRPASPDTVQLVAGTYEFRSELAPLDTVTLQLQLPR